MKKTILLLFICSWFMGSGQGQNITFYNLTDLSVDEPELPNQPILIKEFNEKRVAPWNLTQPMITRKELQDYYDRKYGGNALAINAKDERRQSYGENGQAYDSNEIRQLVKLTELEHYPSRVAKGISIGTTNLRELPTDKPMYLNSDLGGEGYPFDYWQVSSIATNTPVAVLHSTSDGSWLMIQTPNNSWGWVRASNIASLTARQVKVYTEFNKHVSITSDNSVLSAKSGAFLMNADIGSSFPVLNDAGKNYEVIVATRNAYGEAVFVPANVPKIQGMLRGMAFRTTTFQNLIRQTLNEKYGWGGSFGNRDCSQLLMDIFSVFGIWLPRDSRPQIEYMKSRFSYTPLSDTINTENYAKAKESKLIALGKPYLTFLELNGHIMLYCGEKDNKAIVFHSFWGLRTNDRKNRLIIGKVSLTDLWAGRDYVGIDASSLLIKKVKGFVTLGSVSH